MGKKYEILKEDTVKTYSGKTLYRIRALRDIPSHGINAGNIGGYVETEDNLAHEGDCWVSDSAKVYDDAKIRGNAVIYEDAEVYGHAVIYGCAQIYGHAEIYGHSRICGNVEIHGKAHVRADAYLSDGPEMHENAHLSGFIQTCGREDKAK